MADRLAGKVALVTGGGGGIGEATARLFHEEGARVMVIDLDGEAARSAANGIDPNGERIGVIAADLTKEAEAERAVAETVARFGRLDVLANIAAVRVHGPVTEVTPESWEFVIGVNLLAVAYGCKYAIPAMVRGGGGSIVTVSSANATVGRSGMGQYDATKNAVLALTRSMACDHADAGIRVNAVSPGPTLTPYHVRNRVARTGETMAAAAAMRAAGAPQTRFVPFASLRAAGPGRLPAVLLNDAAARHNCRDPFPSAEFIPSAAWDRPAGMTGQRRRGWSDCRVRYGEEVLRFALETRGGVAGKGMVGGGIGLRDADRSLPCHTFPCAP